MIKLLQIFSLLIIFTFSVSYSQTTKVLKISSDVNPTVVYFVNDTLQVNKLVSDYKLNLAGEGYISAFVDFKNRNTDSIFVNIDAGKKYYWGSMFVNKDIATHFPKKIIKLLKIKPFEYKGYKKGSD